MNNIKLRFDIGALLILKEQFNYDMFKMTPEEMQGIPFIMCLLHVTAVRGGSNITLADIANLTFKEFEPLIKQLDTAMKDGMPVIEKETNAIRDLFQFDKKAVN